MSEVNPPPILRTPRSFQSDPEVRTYVEQLKTILFQLYNRTGGSTDDVVLYSDHTALANIGINTHPQIDTALSNSSTHIADATIHFTVASIDHTAILSIGSNTHAQLDTGLTNSVNHIADTDIHLNTSTTTELEDITASINTGAAKELGYMVKNTTTGLMVFASGNTDGAVWHLYDSSTAHTPL